MEPSTKPRKACDFCYRRKIKCDSGVPICSNCHVYKSECTYVAASRKKKKKKRTVVAKEPIDTSTELSSSSRAEILEARLQQALDENEALKGSMLNTTRQSSDYDVVNRNSEVLTQSDHLELPPKDVVSSLIRNYLSTFNSFFPLFDGQVLLGTVSDWYDNVIHRTLTAWASIHIAMALAQYQGTRPQHPQASVADCLHKAQSVVSVLITSDAELASIQVVLGLVILFIGTPDSRPSSVLIATAIQLVHGMMLHRREGYEGLSPTDALQRKRVFWMAYILDRDISLRTRQPPIQHDLEIDVDLPCELADSDGAGIITTAWSSENFNFFRSRIQLARIQGEVYDCLYSVSAQQMTLQDTTIRAMQLRQSINEWQLMIPPDFSAEVLSHDSSTVLPQYFCHLYSPYVACLGQLCRATSMDLPWMDALLCYTRKISVGDLSSRPNIPDGWDILVSGSRSMMNLFMSVQHKEPAFVWTNICTYSSGLVCLAANSVLQIHTSFPDLDQDLKEKAFVFIDQLSQQSNHQGLNQIRLTCAELHGHMESVKSMGDFGLHGIV